MLSKFTVALFFIASTVSANDPPGVWVKWSAPNPDTDVITRMVAKTVVQGLPNKGGGYTAIWFGTQTKNGDGALLQPIIRVDSDIGFEAQTEYVATSHSSHA